MSNIWLFPEGTDVESVLQKNKGPNWLLRIFLCISAGIHLIILIKVSGLSNWKPLNYIELELKEMSRPWAREIPRPRQRLRSSPKVENPRVLTVSRSQPPRHMPQKIDRPEEPDNGLGEEIPMPDLGAPVSCTVISQWQPEMFADGSEVYSTAASYLEMVKLRIEQHKRYPQQAQERQIQGRVPVSFVITPEGEARDIKVITPQHELLDEAALKAIRDAVPFPRPPERLFKGAVPLRVVVVFELN